MLMGVFKTRTRNETTINKTKSSNFKFARIPGRKQYEKSERSSGSKQWRERKISVIQNVLKQRKLLESPIESTKLYTLD